MTEYAKLAVTITMPDGTIQTNDLEPIEGAGTMVEFLLPGKKTLLQLQQEYEKANPWEANESRA